MNSLNDLKRRLKVCVSFPDDERSREISKRQFINLELDTVNSARKNAERSVNFVYALFISIFSIDARQRFHAAQNRRLFLDFYRRLSKKLTVCVCVCVYVCVYVCPAQAQSNFFTSLSLFQTRGNRCRVVSHELLYISGTPPREAATF